MDKDLARIVLVAALESTRSISEIVPLIKKHCGPELQQQLSLAIASSVADIQSELIDEVYAIHPDLKAEFEARYKKYGRLC
jgi:hypothetical protein